MQNQTITESTFKLTNLTNLELNTQAEFKKMHTKRVKEFIASQVSSQTHHQKTLNCENLNSNLSNGGFQINNDAKKKLTVEHEEPIKMTFPVRAPVRSLKKVNMEYFRGKKVIFKHSNVRISFEIVGELTN